MSDPMGRVLKLVADGQLSAEEAAPILDALERDRKASFAAGAETTATADEDVPRRAPRFARVEVRESGRRVVDLRIPLSLGRLALGRVPGLSAEQIAEVEQAVTTGAHGPILDIEDNDGDGVRILLE